MLARRLHLTALPRREGYLAAGAATLSALLAFVAMHKLGVAGVLVPLGIVVIVVLLSRPVLAVGFTFLVTVVSEGPSFGIFTFTAKLYALVYKDFSVLDGLVLIAVVSVAADLVRHQRRLRVPRPLAVPLVTLLLAMIAGVVVGHAAGATLRFAITSEHVLVYLLLLPIAVANLDLDRAQVTRLLGAVLALAAVKAMLGLVEVGAHLGSPIEGSGTLTYYEPTANWVIMVAMLSVFALVVARTKAPRWVLLAAPLLLACLLLSYRRSFWIGAVLGLMLVLLLGLSPTGRRLLVPAGLGAVLAVWALGSIGFQSQLPIVKRATTLSPTKLEANAQDRYRLNERTNVLAEIRAHPISGLGVTIPWAATAQTLSLEGEGGGRQYVHFAALWFWLKLGILGLLAFVGLMTASMWVAWQAWRRSREPLLKAFALASLCAMVGLLAIDTTASFTGVDARFTIVFCVNVGLLGLISMTAGEQEDPDAAVGAREQRRRLRLVSGSRARAAR
jgi:hypothetical protein